MAKNGTGPGHGWAITTAFIGQLAIFMAVSTVLVGAGTQVRPVTAYAPMPAAVAVPAITAPDPAIVAPAPNANAFPYTFLVIGQGGGGAVSDVYPQRHSALPVFTVEPGHQAVVKLSVTIPGDLKLTGLTLSFAEVVPEYEYPADQALFTGTADQPLAPGPHTFAVNWPESGTGLQPGTRWLVYLSADSNAVADGSPIATVTVAGTLGTQLP
jgi:hypothetical protein